METLLPLAEKRRLRILADGGTVWVSTEAGDGSVAGVGLG